MNKNVLIGIVIVLIFANVSMMGFIWSMRASGNEPRRGDANRMRTERFFERKLDFDEEQAEQFKKMEQAHMETMEELQKAFRLLNRDFHEAIVMGRQEEEKKISLRLDSLGRLIKQESVTHIRSLAGICSPEQKKRLLHELHKLPDRRGNRAERRREMRKERR